MGNDPLKAALLSSVNVVGRFTPTDPGIIGDDGLEETLLELVEPITRSIVFEDCGSDADWKDNSNLGVAAIKAIRPHIEALTLKLAEAERALADERKRIGELESKVCAADYYIDGLEKVQRRLVIRDLGERKAGYYAALASEGGGR